MDNLTKKQLLERVEVMPGLEVPRAFALHWDEIVPTQLPFVKVQATPDENLPLSHSKLGGYPMLPADFEYPKDEEGNFMFPLAQINFSEVPPLPGYPTSGYLQFYISPVDDVYGMDFDDKTSQKNFRVLFFEAAAVTNHQTDFSFLEDSMDTEELPVHGTFALTFTPAVEYLGVGDVRYEKSPVFDLAALETKYPGLYEEDLREAAYDCFPHNGHKIGGYSFFTQYDPRMYGEEFVNHIMLLQIDSEGDDIMWGDVGVANFFIHPDDLAKKDFTKVMYNWDCG